MSDQPTDQYRVYPTYPQTPPQAPVPVKPKNKLKLPLLLIAALLLGLAIGGASGASAVPEPVTITKEVPVEKIVTKTVTQTPASCLKAIQHAEQIFGVAADMTDHMSEGISAAAAGSVSRINAVTAKIDTLNADLDKYTGDYKTARDSCQASR